MRSIMSKRICAISTGIFMPCRSRENTGMSFRNFCSLNLADLCSPSSLEMIPSLLKKTESGKLRFIGSGANLVDCTYIDNAAKAHVQAFAQLLRDPAPVEGKAYFITQGAPIPIANLINLLLASGGHPPVTKHLHPALARWAGKFFEMAYRILGIAADPPITLFLAQQLSTAHWYDISAARQDFGYEPEVSLEEGMERLQVWYRSRQGNQ